MGRLGNVAVAIALAGGMAVVLPSSAFGAACTALDYQEMKDMSVDELSAEWCRNVKAENEVTKAIFDVAMGYASGDTDALDAEGDKCRGQERRIERVVLQKDSTQTKEALLAACRKTVKG